MTIKITWNKSDILFVFVVIIISIFYIGGASTVPFHPDEATQIFMSQDVNLLFQNPASLFWKADSESDIRQRYRELDAPLTRYLIGIGIKFTEVSPLLQDWDWAKSWVQNVDAGALPDSYLLSVARVSVSILFPFSLLGIYLIGKKISNRWVGWTAAILFGGSALILLHTRRAMTESALLFTMIISLWVMISERKHLWIIALPVALAFNSKYSALPFFLLGILVITLFYSIINKSFSCLVKNLSLYLVSFTLFTFLLNPFLWSHPIQGFLSALKAREELTHQQVETLDLVNPERTLDNLTLKVESTIFQTFLSAPAVADVSNYVSDTSSTQISYFSNPFHNIFTGIIWGAIFSIISISGFFYASFFLIRKNWKEHFELLVLWMGSILQTGFLVFFVPNSFQRYYLPIILFSCLWFAYLIGQIPGILKHAKPTDP